MQRRTPPIAMSKTVQRQGVRVKAGAERLVIEEAARTMARNLSHKADNERTRLRHELADGGRRALKED